MTHGCTLLISALALLTTACRPEASPTPSATPDEFIVDPVPGSEGDLWSREAFRAKTSKEAVSQLDDRWFTVTVQTQAADHSWWSLGPGGQLRSGEILITEIELYQQSHIYPHIRIDTEVGTEHLLLIATPKAVADADRKLGDLIARLKQGESPSVTKGDPHKSTSGSKAGGRHEPGKHVKTSGQASTRTSIDGILFGARVGAVPRLKTRGDYRIRASGAAIDAKARKNGIVIVPFRFEHI